MYKILVLAAVAIWVAVLVLPDDKLHVVFCDVGQGDAILISYGTSQLLVDGGPNDKVLNCLSRHMPFYDKRIEVIVGTHQDSDHVKGLTKVTERYTYLYYVIDKIYAGDIIKLGKINFDIKWPRLGKVDMNENEYGISGVVTYGDFDVLLTADVTDVPAHQKVEILKVPHHGSKTGMSREWLEGIKPKLAVISVGKNNTYGHPTEEVLKLLRDEEVKTLRTDADGEVEVISDGVKWWIR